MSTADRTLIVEARLRRVSAILLAMQCVADVAGERHDAATLCGDLEEMANEELGKVIAALGLDVLNREC